jgi:ATP-binding cassette subfamily B (MDR/TAP) protein 1
VAFSYPSRPDVMIFHDFSLFFAARKISTVDGDNGSGKSTGVALIMWFYDPNQAEQMNCSPYVVVTCQSI